MIEYLVMQIALGHLTYKQIIKARPDLKEKLDAYIIAQNLQDEVEGFHEIND